MIRGFTRVYGHVHKHTRWTGNVPPIFHLVSGILHTLFPESDINYIIFYISFELSVLY